MADQTSDTMRKLKKEKELRAKETAAMSAIASADLLGKIVRSWDTGRTAEVKAWGDRGVVQGMVMLRHESGRTTWKSRHYFDYDFYLA